MLGIDFRDKRLWKYIGSLEQLAGVRRVELKDGRAKGVEAFEVRTGNGLSYTVLSDRCLDIAAAEFRGVPFAYISSTGVVGPAYYDADGLNFLRGFTGGLVATCGLSYLGAPCLDEGEALGLHGRIGNTPAEGAGASVLFQEEAGVIGIHGEMREARFFGEYLILERTIESPLGENLIRITDQVTNRGFKSQPLMMLYHCNFGYPLLQADSELIATVREVAPRDETAKPGLATYSRLELPQPGYAEQVFYLDLAADDYGLAKVALVNARLGFGVYLSFNKDELPYFTQWKQMGEGAYVLGLEPGNCHVEGRARERERGTLEFIEPGERRDFTLEIGILDGQDEIEGFRNEAKKLGLE